MAKIVIDARMWNESGVGRYIRNLVLNLELLDKQNEYFLILLEKDFQKLKLNDNFHKVLGNFKWYGLTEQVKLPLMLKKIKPDLIHFPHFNVPILYSGKYIVTIHDLIHQHFQMRRVTTKDPLTYKIKHFGYQTIFRSAVKKSEKILTPSNYVRNLLINEWNVVPEKIIVTPEAVDESLLSVKESTRSIKKPYILYVGNAHPHKNVEGLIKAFLKMKDGNLQLVLVGTDHYFWQKIKKNYQDENIIYKGFVSDKELMVLYQNAQVYVLPSFEEGFGIPMLEAMALGCPVASSNAASLPEVGGDAALYFNPQDVDDIKDKVHKILYDQKLRNNLIKRGKKRVKGFSWRKLAQQTLEEYQKCV